MWLKLLNKNIWKIFTKIKSNKEDPSLFKDNDKSKYIDYLLKNTLVVEEVVVVVVEEVVVVVVEVAKQKYLKDFYKNKIK